MDGALRLRTRIFFLFAATPGAEAMAASAPFVEELEADRLFLPVLTLLALLLIVFLWGRRRIHIEREHLERSMAALAEGERRFRNLFEHTPAISVQGYDRNRRVIFWNQFSETLYGYSPQEALGHRLEDLIIPDCMRAAVIEGVSKWVDRGELIPAAELTLRRKDGSPVHVFSSHVMFQGHDGEPEMYCIDIDLSARKAAEDQLRKLSLAVEQNPASIVITDLWGNIEYVNRAFERTTGYCAEEVIGQNPRVLNSGKTPPEVYKDFWATMMRGETWRGEFINRHKSGKEFVELAVVTPVRDDDGKVTHFLGIKQDISEQKRAEAEINRLAYYDALTGLPNRALLMDRLGLVLAVSRRQPRQDALILFNIDRFQTINDARGHATGDLLLQALGKRLSGLLREGDTLARIAGDDFAILLQALDIHPENASRRALSVAEKVHAALREPFELGNETAMITASLGITTCPDDVGDTALDILRRADTALHRAKDGGGNQTAFFETAMGDVAKQKFRTERELRRGIPAGELRLFLQSQVDENEMVQGAEVLVRWQHPERGLVPPGVFIPVAEQSDLICELGVWVLENACRLMAEHGSVERALRLSVNISPRHFRQSDFVPWVSELVANHGIDPSRLTLEVTEGLMIDDIDGVVAKMRALTTFGIRFSVDDFGTGYSSLSYLKRLPLHELKIDRSFVQDAPDDSDDAALVETILAVAHSLHLQVVAEGVETARQAAFLNARGSMIHQGYLYGKPQAASEWLEEWHRQPVRILS
ncbi:MAG: EAL domain-containing protein [Azoarcus sp.]|jgi:diguanylate cyclase (GGDEF)-like protein/PAS domain S-box-containing protein|nr:EAL domain-containing protein [Azoarcus sp.]MDX9838265.1 EAL domain-containing protein [Azoarcus sp.]